MKRNKKIRRRRMRGSSNYQMRMRIGTGISKTGFGYLLSMFCIGEAYSRALSCLEKHVRRSKEDGERYL
jgi:hypothetical protein